MRQIEAGFQAGLSLHDDYNDAIRTSTWLRVDDSDHLLFCAIELLPKELSIDCIGKPDHTERVGSKGRVHLRGMRERLSIPEAVDWYKGLLAGTCRLVNKEGKEFELLHNPFLQEPPWPELVTAEHLRWMPHGWSTPRVSLTLQESLPGAVFDLITREQAIEWIRSVSGYKLDSFPELLGACVLFAPNPLVREVEQRLIPHEDGSFTEMFRFAPRIGCEDEPLQFQIESSRPWGVSSITEVEVHPGDQVGLKLKSEPERTSFKLVCPKRGVLEVHEPAFYVKGISFEMALVGGRKERHVPPDGKKKADVITTDYVSDVEKFGVGEPPSDVSGSDILRAGQRERELQEKRSDQKWFNDDRKAATEFLHGIIGSAREQLLIVDPYVARRELFEFALGTTRLSTKIILLTSSEILKERHEETEVGEILHQTICKLRKDHPGLSLEVLVMSGKHPAIHDRFVVCDKIIWMIGPSLNEFGVRGGMAIKIPYPDDVLKAIEDVISAESTLSLETWVAARQRG